MNIQHNEADLLRTAIAQQDIRAGPVRLLLAESSL
jgi:hypothetical protein